MRIVHPYNPFYPLANTSTGLCFRQEPLYHFPDFEDEVSTENNNLYCVLKNGAEVTASKIQESDKPLFVKFHTELSPATLIKRYQGKPSLEERMGIHDSSALTIVAKTKDAKTGKPIIIAEGSLHVQPYDKGIVEVGITISDDFHSNGLGQIMLSHLEDCARRGGFRQIIGYVQDVNAPMMRIFKKAGYVFGFDIYHERVRKKEL